MGLASRVTGAAAISLLGGDQVVDAPYWLVAGPLMLLVVRAWHGRNERRLEVLEGLGLVELTKGHEGRRPRTWVAITREGRSALATEMAALRASWSGSTPRTEHAR